MGATKLRYAIAASLKFNVFLFLNQTDNNELKSPYDSNMLNIFIWVYHIYANFQPIQSYVLKSQEKQRKF